MRWVALVLAAPILFAACGEDSTGVICSQPVAVTYHDRLPLITFTLHLDGVTVTGSGAILITQGAGLGIIGGASDQFVDGTEFIRFAIDTGTATDLTYRPFVIFDGDGDGLSGEATVEAFDAAGTSLGTAPVHGDGYINVSGWFANVPISAFVVTARDNDGFNVARVHYTACQ